MKEFRESIRDVPVVEQLQGPKIDADIKALETLKKKYDDLGIPIPKVSEMVQNYGTKTGQATAGTQTLTNSTGLLNSEMGLAPEEALQAADAIDKNAEAQKQLETASAGTIGPLRDQAQSFEEAKQSIEGGRAGIDAYVGGIENMTESSETLKVKLHEQNEAATENIQQTNALVGSSENYNQALLTIGQSIADHNVKIDQLKCIT